MERRRHLVNVRADGLAPVLGGLLRDVRVRSAALVDVDSGMVLDAWVSGRDGWDVGPRAYDLDAPGGPDLHGGPEVHGELEVRAARYADLVRVTAGVLGGASRPLWDGGQRGCEVVIGGGSGLHHVLRVVPDEHGGLLALAVVVMGPEPVVARVRRRLRKVSAAALTAGPSMARRPSAVRRLLGLAVASQPVGSGVAALPSGVRPGVGPGPFRARIPDAAPAPPSALPPGPRRAG